jgi:hypothetical protein
MKMVLITYYPQNGSVFAPQSKRVTFEQYRQMVAAIGHSEGITWKANFC